MLIQMTPLISFSRSTKFEEQLNCKRRIQDTKVNEINHICDNFCISLLSVYTFGIHQLIETKKNDQSLVIVIYVGQSVNTILLKTRISLSLYNGRPCDSISLMMFHFPNPKLFYIVITWHSTEFQNGCERWKLYEKYFYFLRTSQLMNIMIKKYLDTYDTPLCPGSLECRGSGCFCTTESVRTIHVFIEAIVPKGNFPSPPPD